MYVGFAQECIKYTLESVFIIVDYLLCKHDEANIRIFLQSILNVSEDTDVFILTIAKANAAIV